MTKLTYHERVKLKTGEFALPSQRKYPIDTIKRGRNALARVSQFGSPSEKATVRTKVKSKFPSIGED